MARRELAEVISIHEALTNKIAVQNLCDGSHLGVSRSSCQVGVMTNDFCRRATRAYDCDNKITRGREGLAR